MSCATCGGASVMLCREPDLQAGEMVCTAHNKWGFSQVDLEILDCYASEREIVCTELVNGNTIAWLTKPRKV